jgi:hypothetical protein
MLRLFFASQTDKNRKPNLAYKVINRQKINEEVVSRKHKQIQNYIVDFDRPENTVTTQIIGKALAEV